MSNQTNKPTSRIDIIRGNILYRAQQLQEAGINLLHIRFIQDEGGKIIDCHIIYEEAPEQENNPL